MALNPDFIPLTNQQPPAWSYAIDEIQTDPNANLAIASYTGLVNVIGTYQLNGVTLAMTTLANGTTGTAGSPIVLNQAPSILGGTFNSPTITGGAGSLAGGATLNLAATATVQGGSFNAPTVRGTVSLAGASSVAGAFNLTGGIVATGNANLGTGLVGKIDGSNAAAGAVGEFISSSVVITTVALTSGIVANITSISLPAGDWDIAGNACFFPAGTTIPTAYVAAGSTVSGAGVGNLQIGQVTQLLGTFATGGQNAVPFGPYRLSISVTTTVYLVAQCNFTVSTCTAGGFIGARRAR